MYEEVPYHTLVATHTRQLHSDCQRLLLLVLVGGPMAAGLTLGLRDAGLSSRLSTPICSCSCSSSMDTALWTTPGVHLPRGRQPRDALAKTVTFQVASVEDLEMALATHLANPCDEPEHTEAQFSFWVETTFALAPLHCLQARPLLPDARELSVAQALHPTPDPKDKMRRQRAIAKACVDAIQRTDGFRYSFHNCWNSREDDSFRFSYYCNDSLLNKDRAANGKGANKNKRATKPVYDCKGVLSVKFSATKHSLDIFYKHVPVHKTYEERAPPPRKDAKRRRRSNNTNTTNDNDNDNDNDKNNDNDDDDETEDTTPAHTDPSSSASVPVLAAASASAPAPPVPPAALHTSRPKKPKTTRPDDPRPPNTSLESDLRAQSLRSLLELIQTDPPSLPETGPTLSTPTLPTPTPAPAALPLQSLQTPHAQASPNQSAALRRRPRNSCDLCKAKKTRCDGLRPTCQTCIDKNRQCVYPEQEGSHDRNLSTSEAEVTVRNIQATNNELSELDRMKQELEEARARIQELEREKQASMTPVQTLQAVACPQPQSEKPPQAQHHPSLSHSQAQPQQQQQQRQQPPLHNHRQQLQQLNQATQRAHSSPRQRLHSPQQTMQSATASQQMPQLQAQQNYFATNHSNHSPYATLNRPMAHNSIPSATAQSNIAPQTNLTQPQPQAQMQANSTGLAPAAPTMDNGLYTRNDLSWQSTAYFGYQATQQQQQQPDQWGATRGTGTFR
jgi:hypothetical protein